MNRISDNELIGELRRRLDDNRKSLHELQVMTKKLETVNRKLQESEALKTDFLSNIRNEINNPLTSIIGITEQIMYEGQDSASIVKMTSMINMEAFELDFQLHNIFMAAELESGEMELSISKIDLRKYVNNVVQVLTNKVQSKGLKFVVEINMDESDDELCMFRTDPEKLQTILINLLVNAIEFSLDNKKISLGCIRLDDGSVKFTVQDEGIGIASEKQQLIFDRFSQLDTGVDKSHKGHGLGLSIVNSLVEFLEGELDFKSIAGKGCLFTVVLPSSTSNGEDKGFSENANEVFFDDEDAEEF